jgi:Glycosyltransferase 61
VFLAVQVVRPDMQRHRGDVDNRHVCGGTIWRSLLRGHAETWRWYGRSTCLWRYNMMIPVEGTYRDIEAVRTADVFVAVHGAGTANMMFMRNGTALVEVLPYGFTRYSRGVWPNVFNPTTALRMGFRVRYYGLNIEDRSLSQPSRYEAEEQWFFDLSPSLQRHALPSC